MATKSIKLLLSDYRSIQIQIVTLIPLKINLLRHYKENIKKNQSICFINRTITIGLKLD